MDNPQDKKERARQANRRYRQKMKDALTNKQATEQSIMTELKEIKQILATMTKQNKTRKLIGVLSPNDKGND